MPYLGQNLQVANTTYRVIDDISSGFNGSTTSFALKVQGLTPVPFPVNEQNCLISVGGVPQKPDYTGAEGFKFTGSNIVFSSAPAAGEKFWGVILAGADYVAAGVTYPNGTANTPSITFGSNTSTGLFLSGTNVLGIATGGVQAVTVDSSQRVGIGTSSPNSVLQVNSGTNLGGILIGFNAGSSNFYDADLQVFRSGNGTERARIDSSGRLLVGTSSTPSGNRSQYSRAAVTGNSTSATGHGILAVHSGSATSSLTSGNEVGQITFGATDGDFAWIQAFTDAASGANNYPGRLVFSTTASGSSSPTERMRITAAGALSYSPCSGADVVGTEACGFVGDGIYAPVYKVKSALTSTKNCAIFVNGNGQVGSIQMNASATSYNTSSDHRLKENVLPITGAVKRLLQLKPSRFNFIADPNHIVDGFIAHEAQAVVPECVTGTKDDVDIDGNPVYQGIDQSKLVPLLTAALQEAIGRIETLEAEVAALKGA